MRRAVSQAIEILLEIYIIFLLFGRVSYEDKHISKMVTCLLNQRLKCVDYYF